jgi:hypothetical protein
MAKPWFKKKAWIYMPISWEGILICLVFIFFCVHIFLAIDAKSHSVSDTLYGIFPFLVPAFLVYIWIGSESSKIV